MTKLVNYEVCIPNATGTEIVKRVTIKVPVNCDANTPPGEETLTLAAHRIINGTKRYHMDLIKREEARNASAEAC